MSAPCPGCSAAPPAPTSRALALSPVETAHPKPERRHPCRPQTIQVSMPTTTPSSSIPIHPPRADGLPPKADKLDSKSTPTSSPPSISMRSSRKPPLAGTNNPPSSGLPAQSDHGPILKMNVPWDFANPLPASPQGGKTAKNL